MGDQQAVSENLHLSNPLVFREKSNQAEREGTGPSAPQQGKRKDQDQDPRLPGPVLLPSPIFPMVWAIATRDVILRVEEWKR